MRVYFGAMLALTVLVWGAVYVLARERNPRRRLPRLQGEGIAPVLLAMLLSSGALHAAPGFDHLPVNVLVLLLGALLLAAAHEFSRRRGTRMWVPVLGVALIAALGYFEASGTSYGHTKVLGLWITVAAVAITVVVLRAEAQRVRFLQGVVVVGAFTLAVSIFAPSSDVALGRVAATGATTIATGRMAGGAIVVLLAWLASGRIRLALWGPVVAALGVVMVSTGARGPLVAAGLALGVVLLVTAAKHPARTVVLVAALAGVAFVAWNQASEVSRARISLLVAADKGASVSQRQFMWARSWDLAQSSPWGRGWAGLENELVVDRYPHNLFLEVLAEAGWLAALILVCFLLVGAIRAFRARAVDSSAVPLLALLIFWVVNALVSGDVTDNRGVFVIAVACWLLSTPAATSEVRGDLDEPDTAVAALT